MASKPNIIYAHHDAETASLKLYVTGFVSSVLLTLVAYLAATRHVFRGWPIVIVLFGLAITQFIVQLKYFLHVGDETKPRWKQWLLFMMIVVVMIVVLGSIWIMYNLNYGMTQQQIQHYLQDQDGGI